MTKTKNETFHLQKYFWLLFAATDITENVTKQGNDEKKAKFTGKNVGCSSARPHHAHLHTCGQERKVCGRLQCFALQSKKHTLRKNSA